MHVPLPAMALWSANSLVVTPEPHHSICQKPKHHHEADKPSSMIISGVCASPTWSLRSPACTMPPRFAGATLRALDADPWVERYAWFSERWPYGRPSTNPSSDLLQPGSPAQLTALGSLYTGAVGSAAGQ